MAMARTSEMGSAGRRAGRRAAQRRRGRAARALRAGAALGAAAGLLLAVGSLAGARPFAGVPGWAWLAVAFACLLVREAVPGPSDVGAAGTDDGREGEAP